MYIIDQLSSSFPSKYMSLDSMSDYKKLKIIIEPYDSKLDLRCKKLS
jgi:hypothetical protein